MEVKHSRDAQINNAHQICFVDVSADVNELLLNGWVVIHLWHETNDFSLSACMNES